MWIFVTFESTRKPVHFLLPISANIHQYQFNNPIMLNIKLLMASQKMYHSPWNVQLSDDGQNVSERGTNSEPTQGERWAKVERERSANVSWKWAMNARWTQDEQSSRKVSCVFFGIKVSSYTKNEIQYIWIFHQSFPYTLHVSSFSFSLFSFLIDWFYFYNQFNNFCSWIF